MAVADITITTGLLLKMYASKLKHESNELPLINIFSKNALNKLCWRGLGGHIALMTVFKTYALPWTAPANKELCPKI